MDHLEIPRWPILCGLTELSSDFPPSASTPIAVISALSRDRSSQEDGIAHFGLNPLAMGVQHLLKHLLLGGNHCPCALSESLGAGSRCILTRSEPWLSPAPGC